MIQWMWQFDLLFLCLLQIQLEPPDVLGSWSLVWRILSITLLACQVNVICVVVWTFLALPFFGIGMKTCLFQSFGHWWVFQICWHIKTTLTASSFRIWNSSAGIPSPPLALFAVMLPKDHYTKHSRMSGSRWVITPSWLLESLRSFLYSSSLHSCQLLLISSASVRSMPFLSFIVPIFPWNVPLIALISWRFLFFPNRFPSIFLHRSLRKPFLSLLAILWSSAFRWIYYSFFSLPFPSFFSAVWPCSCGTMDGSS